MRAELDKLLCERFPLLYRDRHGNPRETLMCFGFEHGDGWFDIIYMLSSALESCIKVHPTEMGDLRAAQVKEKFGGLRFYLDGYPAEEPFYGQVRDLINSAEYLSVRTCETCGAEGSRRGGGWIKTLCDSHAGNREKWEVEDL